MKGFERDAKWKQLNSDGVAAYKKGNYPEAEKLFRLAIAEAQKLGQNDTRVASSLDSLAVALEALKRYGEAERCYFQSGDLRDAIYGRLHPEHLQSIADLADFYLRIGDWRNPALLCEVFNVLAEEAREKHNEQIRSYIFELCTDLTKRVLELKDKVERRATSREAGGVIPEYLQLTSEEEREEKTWQAMVSLASAFNGTQPALPPGARPAYMQGAVLINELEAWSGSGKMWKAKRALINGAQVNASDERGMTALHYAVKSGELKIVELLLTAGANASAKSHSGETPVDIANARNNQSLKQMLARAVG